jgi:hypothetical protein
MLKNSLDSTDGIYGSRLLDGMVNNKYHCNENAMILCAEGAVVNLLHMLHMSDHKVGLWI